MGFRNYFSLGFLALLVTILFLQVGFGGFYVAASPVDWPMFHFDPAHTGATSEAVASPFSLMMLIQPAQATPPPTPSWSVLIDQSSPYAGTSSLRGVAVSSDGSLIYTTWIQQSPTWRQVREYTSSGTLLHSFSLPASPTNPTGDPAGREQAKSIAVDDRGYVYIGSGDRDIDSVNPYILVLSSDLSTMVSGKVSTTDSATMQKRIGGADIWKNGGKYYLYISRESGTNAAYIQRFNVTDPANPVLDITFGSGGTFNIQTLISGAGYPEGLTVAADGTIYVASYSTSNSTNGVVYRISSNLASASSATVYGAFDVSLFGGYLFVTQYLDSISSVAVLDRVSLALVETITPPFPHLYATLDSGYSGICVSSGGKIYVADQFYNVGGGLYSDRLLVGTLQASSITVSSSPTGSGLVAVDGGGISTPNAYSWIQGDTHTLAASSPVSWGAGCQLVFVSWTSTSIGTVGSASFTYTVPSSGETVTANYKTQYQLTVQANPSGGGTPTPSSGGWYDSGSNVQIQATPSSGYVFSSWTGSGSGSYSGTDNSATITMNGPITETANFQQSTVSITITSNPSGSGFVKVDGSTITTLQTFTWTVGSTHTLEAISPVSGGSGTQYVWTGWSDGGDRSHLYTAPSSSQNVTANYKTQYQVTFTSSGINEQSSSIVVTVNSAAKTQSQLPFTDWYNSGATINYGFSATVSGGTGKEYLWGLTSGLGQSGRTGSFPATQMGIMTAIYAVVVDNKTVPAGAITVVGNSTLNVIAAATNTGTPTIIVAAYTANPIGAAPFIALGKYIDVKSSSAQVVNNVTIRVHYTHAELTAANVTDSMTKLYWWTGTAWQVCSDTGVDTVNNFIWATITATSTPNLSQLAGSVFGVGAEKATPTPTLPTPRPVGGVVLPVNKLALLSPYLALGGLFGAVTVIATAERRRKA